MTRPTESSCIGDRMFGWVVLFAFLAFLVHRPVFQLIESMAPRDEIIIQLSPNGWSTAASYACYARHSPP